MFVGLFFFFPSIEVFFFGSCSTQLLELIIEDVRNALTNKEKKSGKCPEENAIKIEIEVYASVYSEVLLCLFSNHFLTCLCLGFISSPSPQLLYKQSVGKVFQIQPEMQPRCAIRIKIQMIKFDPSQGLTRSRELGFLWIIGNCASATLLVISCSLLIIKFSHCFHSWT